MEGTILATASDKGTLIRIFSTEDGGALCELRRGSDKAEIFSITFDKFTRWLACSSGKGTIHIFTVPNLATRVQLSDENAKDQEAPQDDMFKAAQKPEDGEAATTGEPKKPKNSKHV
jgi:WD40 repeat protein